MKKAIVLLSAVALLSLLFLPASGQPTQDGFVKSVRYIPPTAWEAGAVAGTTRINFKFEPNSIYADRKVYWNDDNVGQFLVSFLGTAKEPLNVIGKQVTLELWTAPTEKPAAKPAGGLFADPPKADPNVKLLHRQTLGPLTQPKLALLLGVGALKPGTYRLKATLVSNTPRDAEVFFDRADKANPVIQFPKEGLEVRVDPQTAVAIGDWPICTGVPFPQGTLYDVSKLSLWEDGKPVPAQIEKVATWHPEAEGVSSSVSWARLSFVAHYDQGKPRKYLLKLADAPAGVAVAAKAGVKVATQGEWITVDNGVIKFQVSTKSFRGVETAWYDADGNGQYSDDEKVLSPAPGDDSAGAYIVDQNGTVYRAAAADKPTVVVEEAGPVRSVIAAEGWYTSAAGSARAGNGDSTAGGAAVDDGKLCLFKTRIITYVGEPMVRIYHHTILTFDSNKTQLADVGFNINVQGGQSWSMGADGRTVGGAIPSGDSTVFMHQYRWDKLRIAGNGPESQGQKSDGWFTIKRKELPGVSVLVRDFWQKFPKEMEIGAKGFDLHFWPKHGIETFTRPEMIAKKDIYKLWFYDQGKLLDLKFPMYAYDALKAFDAKEHWDVEEMTEHAKSGNAQGVAIGNEFVLRFHPAAAADQPAQAALFQRDPHAITDPRWNAKTLVEGKISPYDPAKFPLAEQALDTFCPDYMKAVVDAGTEYGMWTYTDVHDFWNAGDKASLLHRVWSASHYRNVSNAWVWYFRGNSPECLIWAAANTDHFMDIDTVNYSSYAKDENGHLRTEFKWHTPGAMYHAKGFTPWGSTAYHEKTPDSYAGIAGHWTNPDAFRYRYLLEGNRRALDLYTLWGESMKKGEIPSTFGRDVNGTLGEELSYYTTTWDPDFIRLIDVTADGMTSVPMDQMPAPYDHPGWHRFWYSRLYTLTRDERVKAAVLEYSKNYGKKFATMMAWDYQQTGDKSYLDVSMPQIYDLVRDIYRNPADPVSGYRDSFADYDSFIYQELPYWLEALNEAGITEITPGKAGRSLYPHAGTHMDYNSEKHSAVMLLALKTEDKPINFRLESIPGYDTYAPIFRLMAPNGATAFERPAGVIKQERFIGKDAITFTVPKDGQTGLYRLNARGAMDFFAPYTDLPVEGTLIDPNVNYPSIGRMELYLLPLGDRPRIQFTWKQVEYYNQDTVSYVHLEDAAGHLLFETTLLGRTKRESAQTFDLDTTRAPGPYKLYMFGGHGPALSWTGTAKGIITATTPEQAKALAAAMGQR